MNKITDSFPAELQPERARLPSMDRESVQPIPDSDVPDPSPTPPITEPEPDLLPDDLPTPNPDENRDPPMRAGSAIGDLVSSLAAELTPGWVANTTRGPATELTPNDGPSPAGSSGTSGSTGP